MEEIADIYVNYRGEDYKISVDLQTANTLLNDQQLAEKYIEAALCDNVNAVSEDSNNEPQHEVEETVETVLEAKITPTITKVWYSKGRPTADDEEATKLFLQLRQKYNEKFNDKKTVKSFIWKKIAQEMIEAGYDLCANSKEGAGAKCKQKFHNMERAYINHIKIMKSTGEGKKDPPPYFNELHSILGEKDKVDPKHLQDSEETDESNSFVAVDETSSLSTDNEQPSCSSIKDKGDEVSVSSIKNRFCNVKKRIKPKNSVDIITELKRQHDIDRNDRMNQFSKLCEVLHAQNNQRNQMLDLFKEFINSKKRKHDSDDDQ